MLLRGLLSAVSDSRSTEVPPCNRNCQGLTTSSQCLTPRGCVLRKLESKSGKDLLAFVRSIWNQQAGTATQLAKSCVQPSLHSPSGVYCGVYGVKIGGLLRRSPLKPRHPSVQQAAERRPGCSAPGCGSQWRPRSTATPAHGR